MKTYLGILKDFDNSIVAKNTRLFNIYKKYVKENVNGDEALTDDDIAQLNAECVPESNVEEEKDKKRIPFEFLDEKKEEDCDGKDCESEEDTAQSDTDQEAPADTDQEAPADIPSAREFVGLDEEIFTDVDAETFLTSEEKDADADADEAPQNKDIFTEEVEDNEAKLIPAEEFWKKTGIGEAEEEPPKKPDDEAHADEEEIEEEPSKKPADEQSTEEEPAEEEDDDASLEEAKSFFKGIDESDDGKEKVEESETKSNANWDEFFDEAPSADSK